MQTVTNCHMTRQTRMLICYICMNENDSLVYASENIPLLRLQSCAQ